MVASPAAFPRVDIVRATDDHADALAAFIREVRDPTATGERVREERAAAARDNPVAPGSDIPTYLFLSGGRVLGHVTTIPVRVWDGQLERAGHWIKGLCVLPEHRNGPVGLLLLREAVRGLGPALAAAGPHAPRRLYTALGFADLGRARTYIRLLQPARVLQRADPAAFGSGRVKDRIGRLARAAQRLRLGSVAGRVLGLGADACCETLGRPSPTLAVGPLRQWDLPEVDLLWLRARVGLAASPVRDAAYLRWRYPIGGDSPYEALAARQDLGIAALAVLRAPRPGPDSLLEGVRVASLTDLVYPLEHRAAGLAVVAAAERRARDLDADAIVCAGTHRALGVLLARRAYFPVPGRVHILIRDPSGRRPARRARWWITGGDSEDEGFP